MVEKTGVSGRSIAAMVVGICSLPIFIPIPLPGMIPGLGLVLGIVAVVLATIELKAITKGEVGPRNRGFAVTGLATGIVGTITGVFVIIFGVLIIPAICGAIARAAGPLRGGFPCPPR